MQGLTVLLLDLIGSLVQRAEVMVGNGSFMRFLYCAACSRVVFEAESQAFFYTLLLLLLFRFVSCVLSSSFLYSYVRTLRSLMSCNVFPDIGLVRSVLIYLRVKFNSLLCPSNRCG